MKNFPVIIDNKEYWISRSMAVAGFIFTTDQGLRVLAIKRGKGCPDEVGKWCCPCGYLDYDETLEFACKREIKEETNLSVSTSLLHLFRIDSDPKSNRQNVTLSYWSYKDTYYGQTVTGEFGEPDEVDDVEWIGLEELDQYDWAFGHKYLIMEVAVKYLYYRLSEATLRRFEEQLKERNILGTDA